MTRYIDEKDVYKLVEPTGTARVHCSQIDELPRADVVPKSEVEKIFEEIEKIIASHGITIGLVFDEAEGAAAAICRIDRKIAEFKKEYMEGEK
jgi:hypothetical protein